MAIQPLRGKMMWFNEAKTDGVISMDDAERLPVDGSAFEGEPPHGPCSGLVVEVARPRGRRGRPAPRPVRVVPEPEARRARRRRSH